MSTLSERAQVALRHDLLASIVVFLVAARPRESGALARLGVSRRGGTFLKAVALMGAVAGQP
jgi:hypothetical protein